MKAELQDRSFRQFEPSVDAASPRKGVILSFFGPLTIWAQYAEGNHALNEWEIAADDYRVEEHGGSEITLHLDAPRSAQALPTWRCDPSAASRRTAYRCRYATSSTARESSSG